MLEVSPYVRDSLDQSKIRFVDVRGIRTRVYEDGAGEALVMFHGGQYGMTSALDTFSLNLPTLAQHFHVIAVDKLGQGHTANPRRDADYTFEALLAHTMGVIGALNVEQGYFLGHSRGGLLVTRIALEHPELVKKLIIVDSNSTSPDPDMAGPFRAKMAGLIPPATSPRESIRLSSVANSYSDGHITADYLDRLAAIAALPKSQEAAERMKTVNDTVWLPSLGRVREATFRTLEERGFPMPALVIWGFDDKSAPMHQCLQLWDLICRKTAQAELHVLNRAGHHSFREQPDAFFRTVRSFCLD